MSTDQLTKDLHKQYAVCIPSHKRDTCAMCQEERAAKKCPIGEGKGISKGKLVRSIETGWTGIVTMAGTTIVQVRFSFTTANGRVRTMKSAWRVSDLEVLDVTQ